MQHSITLHPLADGQALDTHRGTFASLASSRELLDALPHLVLPTVNVASGQLEYS